MNLLMMVAHERSAVLTLAIGWALIWFLGQGLLIGLAVPVLGAAAAIGLVLYFIGAMSAHMRVRDPGIGGAVSFLVLAVAALIAGLGYHNQW